MSAQCTRCGANFVGTPENPAKPGLCNYCQVTVLRTALVGLVGVDTKDELEAMRNVLQGLKDPAIVAPLAGVEALLATL